MDTERLNEVFDYITYEFGIPGLFKYCKDKKTRDMICEDVKEEFPDMTDKLLSRMIFIKKPTRMRRALRFIVRCLKFDLLVGANDAAF